MNGERAAVVTGLGAVTPFGVGMAAFGAGLRGEREPVFVAGTVPPLGFPVVLAPLPAFDFAAALEPHAARLPESAARVRRSARRAGAPVQALALAALEAWAAAGLPDGATAPERAGILLAAQNASTGLQHRLTPKFLEAPDRLTPSWGTAFMDSFPLGVLAEALGLMGEGATVGAASASGNVALIQAWRMIACGAADVCVVAAPPADLSPMDLQGLRNLGALGGAAFAAAPMRACRPFDRAADGFIPGQAAAALVLEAAGHAAARGVRPLAVLAGGAVALSAVSHTAPDEAAEERAMRQALACAGLTADAVDCVNAHATSTPLGDRAEADALAALFGGRPVPVNATKGLTGHALWAAGLVEAAAVLAQMAGGFLHANRNLDDPVRGGLDLVGGAARPATIRAALSNGFGFSGIHSSVVFRAPA